MKTIAVIGSRKMSSYGRWVVGNLVPILIKKNYRIITAKTNGVNAEIARVARRYGAKLRLVEGKEINVKLANLADTILIVEGGKSSGTMLAAKEFLELGKEVWAIPGRIEDEGSFVPNFLISNGARIIVDLNDI